MTSGIPASWSALIPSIRSPTDGAHRSYSRQASSLQNDKLTSTTSPGRPPRSKSTPLRMIIRQRSEQPKQVEIAELDRTKRVLCQYGDRRKPPAVQQDLFERKPCVLVLFLKRLERIGAVRDVHRSGGNVETLEVLHVPCDQPSEGRLGGGMVRRVARRIAVSAFMGAARVTR